MAQVKWVLDPSHSEIQFKVKHLMITTVTGYFKKFEASAVTEGEDMSTAKISFNADIDSIDTNSEQRDGHLKSADFFDAANHPQMIFSNGKLEGSGSDYTLLGDLTIRGNTHPVKLNVEFGGIAQDPYGQTKAGFTLSGKINRKDFGLTWGAVTEAGNVVVSDEVRINAEIQLTKKVEEEVSAESVA
ncbi:MAG: YceI family protein [Chitinophagaceae bacterium]|nr:YceI family protein [Chitinophagaceae bacterium]MCB9046848.1 YceI family protein [Chitinophagales bacterium]